jgi:signal transduction histidine kinase
MKIRQPPMSIDRSSLRWRLPWLFALMAIITVAAFGFVAYRAVRSAALAATNTRLKSTLTEIKAITELGVINQLESLKTAAADLAVIEALRLPHLAIPEAADVVLRRLRGTAERSVEVDLVRRDGSRHHRIAETPATDEIVEIPADATIGPLQQRDGELFFQSSAPVRIAGATIGGIRVTRHLAKSSANRRIAANTLGQSAALLVGNRNGTMWNDGRAVEYPAAAETSQRYVRDGRAWLTVADGITGTPWRYAVELPEGVALAPVHALFWPFLIVGSVIAIAGALIGVQVGRRITGPLAELTAATEAIARGESDVRIAPSDRRDEIGRLSRAFGTMSASVRGARQRLEAEIDSGRGELSDAVHRLRQLDDELRKNERLATLGRLSSSVGHELRNPLGVMSNVVFLIDALPDASPRLKDYSRLLREQIRLSERIISDLLDHARSGAPVYSTVELPCFIGDLLSQVKIPDSIKVERKFIQPLPAVLLDRDKIGQILWNLITNAVQAMPGRAGTLTVIASVADGKLRTEVCDTGDGVRSEDAERIFEPMYTTKAHGVGLGLSISRAFARANGGDLFVKANDDGPGACFVLELPVEVASEAAAVRE